MENSSYQVAFMGNVGKLKPIVVLKLVSALKDIGLPSLALKFIDEDKVAHRDKRFPFITVYVGSPKTTQNGTLNGVIDDSSIIIPIVSDLSSAKDELPKALHGINAISSADEDYCTSRVVTLILEHFRLLRKERKVFISYRRSDSQIAANQIYDALDERGFDVFIDTRSVPPAVDFQDILWHRMSDSDIVLLLDTPGFKASRWTVEEHARANLTNIQILHLLWPGQDADAESAFSHFHFLKKEMFSEDGTLLDRCLEEICEACESLRARSIAARHRYITDSFCDLARDMGLSPDVQPSRWIILSSKTKRIFAVPAVGIPTSDRINDISDTIASVEENSECWILYDDRGMLASWREHLRWLGKYLPARSINVGEVANAIRALKDD